jgi:hypothetical protein
LVSRSIGPEAHELLLGCVDPHHLLPLHLQALSLVTLARLHRLERLPLLEKHEKILLLSDLLATLHLIDE